MRQDSYIDEIVNNSNFSNNFSKLDSKILNMEPYWFIEPFHYI